jgi:hypothetical protein
MKLHKRPVLISGKLSPNEIFDLFQTWQLSILSWSISQLTRNLTKKSLIKTQKLYRYNCKTYTGVFQNHCQWYYHQTQQTGEEKFGLVTWSFKFFPCLTMGKLMVLLVMSGDAVPSAKNKKISTCNLSYTYTLHIINTRLPLIIKLHHFLLFQISIHCKLHWHE